MHPAAPCSTVKVVPATVSVPVRAAPGLTATVYDTVPFPVPAAPPVTVIQPAFATALHPQPWIFAVTPTEPSPPAAANEALGLESE